MTFPAALFPDSTHLTSRNALSIDGCDLLTAEVEN
jgi:hypothetical protein